MVPPLGGRENSGLRMYHGSATPLLGVVTVAAIRGERQVSSTTPATHGSRPQADGPGAVWGQAAQAFDRWVADDADGLRDLVAVMTPVLWHVVRAYGLPRDLAEDVIQTTWLALVRRSHAIVDTTAVGGWLTTTARREAWRAAKGAGTALPADDDEIAVHLPRQRSAEADAVDREGSRLLWAAVDKLPERCRRLLRVIAFENRPDYATLAADLGMPVGSIGPTRGRCLAKLRVALISKGDL